MNILAFDYEYPPVGGGGGVVHQLICEELAADHRVSVVTSGFADLPGREVRNGVEIHRVPVWGRRARSSASLRSLLTYPPAAWARGLELVRKERFDVVNAHFAVPTGPGSVPVTRLAGLPHVLSVHGGDVYDPSKRLSPHRFPPVRAVVTRVLRASDAVVAGSTNTRDNIRRHTGYRGRVDLIPLGIREPEVPEANRRSLDLPEGAFLAVTVGRLVRRKAVDVLLRILARPALADVHLIVMGSGPELEPLRALAAELGLGGRVRFPGFVEETRKWQVLRAADVYVSSTMHEGFGLVYLEAMASGLPVVTYDHGGQTDFLVDGETGYLVPAGDPEGLENALARLAARPREARRMGRHNRERFDRHRIEGCAAAYEELFERVIAEKSRRDVAVSEKAPQASSGASS